MNDLENVRNDIAVPPPAEDARATNLEIPEPVGLGSPRHVQQAPFAQELLPGMESFVDETPPAEETADATTASADADRRNRSALLRLAAAVLAAAAFGFGITAAFLFLREDGSRSEDTCAAEPVESFETAQPIEPDGIPPELLGSDELVDCWTTVSEMKGRIGIEPLEFHRGIATSGGATYRVVLDFCRDGDNTLVKVSGNGLWIVKVGADGTIVRSYRCPRADIPLKQILGL